jgi:hypothetical protein
MAQFFVERAHYQRKDQFVCVVDGGAHIKLVPHINRQEMYAGKGTSGTYFDGKGKRPLKVAVNESPVNLFDPDLNRFPNLKFVNELYSEYLNKGDCIFVPAYYYYQMVGEAELQEAKGDWKPAVLVASL